MQQFLSKLFVGAFIVSVGIFLVVALVALLFLNTVGPYIVAVIILLIFSYAVGSAVLGDD